MRALLCALLLMPALHSAQTIHDKQAAFGHKREIAEGPRIQEVNAMLAQLRQELAQAYDAVHQLDAQDAEPLEYKALLEHIRTIKLKIAEVEAQWRQSSVAEGKREEEGYAFWDQEETTLGNLVMEYGAMDYLYIVPPEIAAMKINVHSMVSVPRESWSDVLEILLAQNGVGVKKTSPYVRHLFVFKHDPSCVGSIVARPEDLQWVDTHTRLFYILSPPIEQAKSVFHFFERVVDGKQTFVYQIGTRVALVSSREEVEKLLSLYEAVWKDVKGKVCRVVCISKMPAREMEKILLSFFGEMTERNKPPFGKLEQDGLIIHSPPQGNSLILIGTSDVVERAQRVVKETEDQMEDPAEMTVYLYACQNSDPADLAKVLEKVYSSLLVSNAENVREGQGSSGVKSYELKMPEPSPGLTMALGSTKMAPPTLSEGEGHKSTEHFIPDLKTGHLLMVVRRDVLPRIKDLLRRLDVAKKMVQIEVLLFEKRLSSQSNFGLNLLRIGESTQSVTFTPSHPSSGGGVLEYLLKRGRHGHVPPFNLAYNFLMAQEDIQLHAAPSVIAVNQTPASISIVEEISINNGVIDTEKKRDFERSFTRAQYGITITLTPTVHLPVQGEEEGKGFVTLKTNITFDTTKPNSDDRPLVDRRHIENEVRVLDGQTVVIGGLRRKSSQDREDKVPLLGEIPGIGKLFGSTHLADNNTEMFFFITPRIIQDSQQELDSMRLEELKRRPGDIPEFLQRLTEARAKEKGRFLAHTMKLFFQQ